MPQQDLRFFYKKIVLNFYKKILATDFVQEIKRSLGLFYFINIHRVLFRRKSIRIDIGILAMQE
jgi:hypothetical protein